MADRLRRRIKWLHIVTSSAGQMSQVLHVMQVPNKKFFTSPRFQETMKTDWLRRFGVLLMLLCAIL